MSELDVEVKGDFMSATKKTRYLPDVVGLIALMAMVATMSAFVSSSKVPGPLWVAIYFVWAAGAVFVWHKAEVELKQCLFVVVSSIGGAALWYVATRAISSLAFGDGEPALSKVIDLAIALMMSPGLTFIAIAGWVRKLMQIKLATGTWPPLR